MIILQGIKTKEYMFKYIFSWGCVGKMKLESSFKHRTGKKNMLENKSKY
jgi:23S rRNA A2030 N6-methylase RlmJ